MGAAGPAAAGGVDDGAAAGETSTHKTAKLHILPKTIANGAKLQAQPSSARVSWGQLG